MTLLSLFMTSTGIFCFVPISQRLIESGIVPASDTWRLPSFLVPRLHRQRGDKDQRTLPEDGVKIPWSETKLCSHDSHISVCLEEDTFVADLAPVMKCPDEWDSGMASSSRCGTADSRLNSPSSDLPYGRDSASFFSDSDSILCDSCNSLLQKEIPPDHIPSVIRALALFEAQDQLHDVGYNEYEIVALTNAFSMLRL